jgi:hypothetical protein
MTWSNATTFIYIHRQNIEVTHSPPRSELTPQSLANVLWSFAFLAMWESKMMLAPLEAVHSYAEAFNPRDLSNTLWALSMYKASGVQTGKCI